MPTGNESVTDIFPDEILRKILKIVVQTDSKMGAALVNKKWNGIIQELLPKRFNAFFGEKSIDGKTTRVEKDSAHQLLVNANKQYYGFKKGVFGIARSKLDILTDELQYAVLEGHHVKLAKIIRELTESNLLQQVKQSLESKNIYLLHIAASKGFDKVIGVLFNSIWADVNQADSVGALPVHYACQAGHKNLAKELLAFTKVENYTKITNKNYPTIVYVLGQQFSLCGYQKSLLHLASYSGLDEIVAELLKITSDKGFIETKDGHDKTAMHYACKGGHLAVVKLLSQANADLRPVRAARNKNLPLHAACKKNHYEVVKFILEKDKDQIKFKGTNSRTPLDLSCTFGDTNLLNFILSVLNQTSSQLFLAEYTTIEKDKSLMNPTHHISYDNNKEREKAKLEVLSKYFHELQREQAAIKKANRSHPAYLSLYLIPITLFAASLIALAKLPRNNTNFLICFAAAVLSICVLIYLCVDLQIQGSISAYFANKQIRGYANFFKNLQDEKTPLLSEVKIEAMADEITNKIETSTINPSCGHEELKGNPLTAAFLAATDTQESELLIPARKATPTFRGP